ncbi:MAG: sugar-transfer associated ATP-grasp domain-containing protein [Bacteroidales bacterium]|nr:sugar-transfer associated ATP-grasp domain-containing protein [Bacteroidales bacterium]
MLNVKGEFDVRYCPEKIFRLYLDPALADRKLVRAWNDKNYYNIFQPALPLPHAYVRNVNGYFLDHDYQPISKEKAKNIIVANLPVIIKPSLISGEGKNLKLISNKEEADAVFEQYEKDYIVQKLVIQCDELKKMSPRCVNTFRIITAMVDGEPEQLTGHLLCNTTDSVAGNAAPKVPGTGVVLIKTDDDGRLSDTGYYENAKTLQTLPSGFTFGGLQIPSFKEAVKTALEAHKSMPMFGFIGWDITINETAKPIVIEWNLGGIEIYHSQLTNGPLFGQYSDYFAEMARKLIRDWEHVHR